MRAAAITSFIWLGLAMSAATATAQSPGADSKAQLSEIRALVHTLQGHTETLRELTIEHASHLERRPQPEGSGAEGKRDHDKALAKWYAALDRLLRRIDEVRATVVDAKQRLEQAASGKLPTSLAKDVANARNDADAERANAERALAKSKPDAARAAKEAKKAPPPEKAPPPLPDDLDL